MAAVESVAISAENSKQKPLYIFYDCEAGNSQLFTADIIEIAARCYPEIRNTAFESLISTTQELGKFTVERCGIKASDLEGKPKFDVVFKKFINWMHNLLKRVNQKTGERYFPVLCAHNGYGFDYTILLSNMKRYGIKEHVLKKINLHFADTFQFCKELQEEHRVQELQDTKLSMDSLFSKFCPGKQFLNRHRAMGDVNAMIEIFSIEPFKTAINNIDYTTSESLCEWFTAQYSEKEQRILLEEKMAKLDAYTRNVYSKKLFQLQLTYDALQAIFENCCSFMDFYEALQDRGIDRRTAKHFACQFGSMGLKNQGTEPYCNLPKSEVTGGLDYSLDNVDLLFVKKETERPPNVPPLPSADVAMVTESSECWDDELDESRSFTFTIPKHAVPLSLTIDDFVSTSSSKQSNSSKGKNSSKQNINDSEHLRSKPVDEIKNLANGSKFGDLAETKSAAKSNTRPNMSRKKPEPADVFRNGASTLQIGTFPNKKERYQLEKELLDQVSKVYKQSNFEKDEVGRQNKNVNEASGKDIPKTNEVIITESTSPRNSGFLKSEGKPNGTEASQKDVTKNKKFPRKFLGKMKRNSGNNRDSHLHKQSSSSSVQGNTAVTTVKRSKKESKGISADKNTAGAKSDAVHQKSSFQETELKPSHDNLGTLNGSIGWSACRNGQSFASIVASSTSRPQEITDRHPNNETKKGELANEGANIIYPKENDLISISAQVVGSKSAVDNRPTSKRQRRPQNVVKDNSSGLERELSGSSVTKDSLVSPRNQGEELKSSNSGKAHASPPQDVLKEDLNEKKTMSNSASLKTSLEPKEAPPSNDDLNNSGLVSPGEENDVTGGQGALETNDELLKGETQATAGNMVAEEGETQATAGSMVTEEGETQATAGGEMQAAAGSMVTEEGETQAAAGSMVTEEGETQAAVLKEDEQKNTEKTHEKDFSQQGTTVLQRGKKMKERPEIGNNGTTILVGKDQKQNEKLKRIKQNCEPVVFVNRKSIEKKQKNWPRVEMFVGDFPIHVPVDPSMDDRIEEKFDLNAELKGKPHCSSSAENRGLLIGDSNSEHNCQSDKVVQVLDSVDDKLHFSCQENDSCGELETQPGENEQSLDNVRTDGMTPSNVEVINDDNSNQSTLSQEQCDDKVDTNEEAENIVTNELQGDLISEDSNVTSWSSREIPENRTVKTTDSSQQTELDWYNEKEIKKLVDQEQQTDCALLSTFNIETSHVQTQDKETLTDRSRRAQSIDTISSYGDNLSDSYGTSPSSPLYPYDIDPHYDINTEVFNRQEYESPVRVFDISMSPHHEDRYLEEDTPYPEKNTQYLKENTRYPETQYLEEVTRYEIPSPEESEEFYYTREYQHIPRAGVYHNSSSNPNVLPERFHPCPPVPPPIYPANPNGVPAAPLFHQRFPQHYFQRLPRNAANILPHKYHGPLKF